MHAYRIKIPNFISGHQKGPRPFFTPKDFLNPTYTIKNDLEVETEPNVHQQYEENIKQVEWKLSADIFVEAEDEKNVDVISRLI